MKHLLLILSKYLPKYLHSSFSCCCFIKLPCQYFQLFIQFFQSCVIHILVILYS